MTITPIGDIATATLTESGVSTEILAWENDYEWDTEVDSTGMVHDASYDHAGLASSASGYHYGQIQDPIGGGNLVSWWPLHELNGQASDLGGNNNHGTVNGATQGVGGRGGLTAYSFDGSDDYVSANAPFTSDDDFSVSLWFNPDDVSSEAYLFDNRNTTYFIMMVGRSTGGELSFYDGSNHTVITSLTTGTWYHYTVTYDAVNDQYEAYVDGVHEASVSSSNGTNSGGLGIGANPSGSNPFNGTISNVRAYDRILSPSEVQTLYNLGSADTATPPDNNDNGVNYYNFNSANANDQWGSNDGTVNGATHQASGGPREDGAYSFDGTDDYIEASNAPVTGSTNRTVNFWANPDTNSSNSIAVFWGRGESNGSNAGEDYAIYLSRGSNEIRIEIQGSGYTTSNLAVTNGVWQMVTIVLEGTTLGDHTIYLNTEAENASGSGSINTQSDYGTMLGAGDRTGGETRDLWWSGDLDEVRIYDRALSASEIHELYRYGTLGIDMSQYTVKA